MPPGRNTLPASFTYERNVVSSSWRSRTRIAKSNVAVFEGKPRLSAGARVVEAAEVEVAESRCDVLRAPVDRFCPGVDSVVAPFYAEMKPVSGMAIRPGPHPMSRILW